MFYPVQHLLKIADLQFSSFLQQRFYACLDFLLFFVLFGQFGFQILPGLFLPGDDFLDASENPSDVFNIVRFYVGAYPGKMIAGPRLRLQAGYP